MTLDGVTIYTLEMYDILGWIYLNEKSQIDVSNIIYF